MRSLACLDPFAHQAQGTKSRSNGCARGFGERSCHVGQSSFQTARRKQRHILHLGRGHCHREYCGD